MDTVAPIPTRTEALLTLAHWLSPSFPIGAFSYSHGLEAAIADGRIADAEGFGAWLLDVLRQGTGRNDAILLVAGYNGQDQAAELARATAPSAERRLEAEAQGKAFAATCAAIWAVTNTPAPFPVAVGRAASEMRLPLEETLTLYLHAFAANLTSAAIRLVPLGQTEAHAQLAQMAPLCLVLAREAQHQTLDDLGGAAFLSDIASMRHEAMEPRLFRS